jgi:mRNA-degrading endonuclease toxin of MazEF toxin-antitoxin module
MHQYRRSTKAPRRDTGSTPKRGEVWWASRVDGLKDRPVVIVSFSDHKVTFRSYTSQDSSVQMRELIEDYDVAGLDRPTYLSPAIKEMDRARLVRKLGVLSQYDRGKFHI